MQRSVLSGRWSMHGWAPQIFKRGISSLALLLAIGSATTAVSQESNEYAVKAAFLFHFAQLTTWPAQSFARADSPMVFCTVGKDPFDGVLDSAVAGKKIQGHPVKVMHLKQAAGLQSCHIVFISAQEMARVSTAIGALHGQPVLTVGETEEFLKQGGMIDFRSEKDRLRFDVNLRPAQSSNLGFSSTLLSLARNVVQPH